MSGFRTLSDFLRVLERHGDLKRVTHEVDWDGEVTEWACRGAKEEGPALLFEKVRGSSFPLAVNRRSASLATGFDPRTYRSSQATV